MRFHAAVVAAAAAAAVIASVGGGGFLPGPGATGPTPTLIAASYPGSATWPPSGTDEEAGVGARSEQRTAERAHPSRNLADPARSATVDTSTASADQDRDGGDSCPTTAPARTSGRSTDDDSGSSRVTAAAILADLITELAGTTGNTGNRIVQTLLGTADSDTEPARDAAAARVPGDLIDLADWYLTLPTGKQGDPDTVENPDLGEVHQRVLHAQRHRRRRRVLRPRRRRHHQEQPLPALGAAGDERQREGRLVQHQRHAHPRRVRGDHPGPLGQARGRRRADPRRQATTSCRSASRARS